MSNRGIVEFYYTENLPDNSVALARITSKDYTPAQVVDISNTVYQAGTLLITNPDDDTTFQASTLNKSVAISGSSTYILDSQFFELTDVLSSNNAPLFYKHILPTGISQAVILDKNGIVLSNLDILLVNNTIYHDLSNDVYSVRYVDSSGFVQTNMLLFTPVYHRNNYTPGVGQYTYSASVLTVTDSTTRYIRFTDYGGYQAIAPYNAPSNSPWFLRIRYGLKPTPPEWVRQPFSPDVPYLLGTWVSGEYVTSNIIEFERKGIYYSADHLPDILIFDKNNVIKYALDGTSVTIPTTKGYDYPWKRGLIMSVDAEKARVQLNVTVDPTDIIFGFYSYEEKDVLFTDLDVNPFTNPVVRNREIQVYRKADTSSLKYLYYKILDGDTIVQTNDPSPNSGTSTLFANVAVGTSISTSQIDVEDVRYRGGGLNSTSENIPQAINFWDLGYWDGKPFPVAGALIIYLPYAILNSISRSSIIDRLEAILPLGIYPVVRYYDQEGNEYV